MDYDIVTRDVKPHLTKPGESVALCKYRPAAGTWFTRKFWDGKDTMRDWMPCGVVRICKRCLSAAAKAKAETLD